MIVSTPSTWHDQVADLYAHFVWLNSGEAVEVERIVHSFSQKIQMKWQVEG